MVLGLCCGSGSFSRCGEWGLLSIAMCRLLIAAASPIAEHGALGSRTSEAVAHRLSCPTARGIFQAQGLNLCPLHWQQILIHGATMEVPKCLFNVSD